METDRIWPNTVVTFYPCDMQLKVPYKRCLAFSARPDNYLVYQEPLKKAINVLKSQLDQVTNNQLLWLEVGDTAHVAALQNMVRG